MIAHPDRTVTFLVLLCFVLIFSGPAEALSDTIASQKKNVTDTELYRWLKDDRPDRDAEKRKRWKWLLSHDVFSPSEKIEFYRRWNEVFGSLAEPTEQIELALRSGSKALARSWLEQWWEKPSISRSTVTSMVDTLVDAGMLKWARDTLQNVEDRWKFYQRRGAIEEALGKPQDALARDLGAWARTPHSKYLRVQVLTLVRNQQLSQPLIRKTRELTNYAQDNLYMLKVVDQYFIENGDYEAFINWVKTVQPDQERTVRKIRSVRDRLLRLEDIKGAKRLNEWLIQRPEVRVRPEIPIVIDLRSQNLTQASHRLREIDTGVRSEPRFYSLRVELALRSRDFDRLRLLEPLKNRSQIPTKLFHEYLQSTHQYDRLAGELAKADSRPIKQLLIRFRQGKQFDSMVQTVASRNQGSNQLPLALALAGRSNPQPGREFLRLLDQYPLDILVDSDPIQVLNKASFPPPSVLVDEWYKRFHCGSVGADVLRKWGRTLQYPPLLLESAKRSTGRSHPYP